MIAMLYGQVALDSRGIARVSNTSSALWVRGERVIDLFVKKLRLGFSDHIDVNEWRMLEKVL